ncbi:MAG: sasA [Streptosporangiaceae bacterium]|nr:sasA [Streptosporangiaceae bacterium]
MCTLRRRVARWLDPTVGQPPPVVAPSPSRPDPQVQHAQPQHAEDAWPAICDQFALQVLGLAEHLRPALDSLEGDEDDPDRLQSLYQVDHAVTRMRRAARDMRILAGREDEEMSGYTSSLVDVLRVAESSIERYDQISIGRTVELAVVAYAADDVASLLAALLDNATRYSPSTVTVSAHLLENGSVMLRVEDQGIGIAPDHVAVLNAALAGPVPGVDERTGKHTGFPVVHRLSDKHGLSVSLASRSAPGETAASGTIAMVAIPPSLLCEIPPTGPAIGRGPEPAAAQTASRGGPAAPGPSQRPEQAHLHVARGDMPAGGGRDAVQPEEASAVAVGGLPRRERTSLRGFDATPPVREHTGTNDQAAARRSFADDLTAFGAGDQKARAQGSSSTDQGTPEEQVRE